MGTWGSAKKRNARNARTATQRNAHGRSALGRRGRREGYEVYPPPFPYPVFPFPRAEKKDGSYGRGGVGKYIYELFPLSLRLPLSCLFIYPDSTYLPILPSASVFEPFPSGLPRLVLSRLWLPSGI